MGTLRDELRRAGLITKTKARATKKADKDRAATERDQQVGEYGSNSDATHADRTEPLNFLGIKAEREMQHPTDPRHLVAGEFFRKTRDTHGGKARLDREKHGKKRVKPRQGGGKVRKW